jgi:hypothetical protein
VQCLLCRFSSPIGQANAEIARYDGILQSIINPNVLLSPLSTKGETLIFDKLIEIVGLPGKGEKQVNVQTTMNKPRRSLLFPMLWFKNRPVMHNEIGKQRSAYE